MDPGSKAKRISPQEIAAFASGDREAFQCIFERLQNEIAWAVRRLVHGAFDQEEAQQEVWLHLHRVRRQVDVNRPDEFVAWVRRVARNRTIDFLKSRSRAAREIPVDDAQDGQEAHGVSRIPGPEEEASRGALQRSIDDFVQQLDEEEQHFFQLCFVEERSHLEIAAALSIAERRSKYLKKKLLARLVADEGLRAHIEAAG